MQRISRVKSVIARLCAGAGEGMEGDAVARVVGTRRREEALGTFLPFVNGRDARGATGRPSRRANDAPAGARRNVAAGDTAESVIAGTEEARVRAREGRLWLSRAVRARYGFLAKNL